MATRIGCSGSDASSTDSSRGVVRHQSVQGVVKVGHALVVLGRDRDRLTEAEGIGFKAACFTGRPFAFVRDQHDRFAGFARDIGEVVIDGRRARACIDHEKYDVGLIDRRFRLRPHASGEAFR